MSFPRYPEYKDSGIDWITDMPAHWNAAPVSSKFMIRNGFPFAAEQFHPEGLPEDRLVRIRDILGNPTPLYTNESCPADFTINNGDVLIGMDGDFNVVVWESGKAKLNQRVCAVNGPTEEWDRYFFYAIKRPIDIINDLTFSTTVKHLASSQVFKLKFPFPPRAEMEQIVFFLDHETAKIDTLIHEQKRLIELLKEKRQAVISHAVTKGLDPGVPMKNSGVEWLGEVPAHWTLPKVAHYCNVTNGSTPDRSNAQFWNEGNIPWLSSSELNQFHITKAGENITEFALKRSSLSLIKRGAILIGLVGQGKTRGLSARLDIRATINQNVAAIIPRFDQVDSDFLHFVLQHLYIPIREFGRGGQQAALNCEIIETIRIPLPPVNEQKQIARYLTETLSALKQLSRMATQAIDTLQERRSALISAAVTGKIDVRDWQPPVDESAFEEIAHDGQEAIM